METTVKFMVEVRKIDVERLSEFLHTDQDLSKQSAESCIKELFYVPGYREEFDIRARVKVTLIK